MSITYSRSLAPRASFREQCKKSYLRGFACRQVLLLKAASASFSSSSSSSGCACLCVIDGEEDKAAKISGVGDGVR